MLRNCGKIQNCAPDEPKSRMKRAEEKQRLSQIFVHMPVTYFMMEWTDKHGAAWKHMRHSQKWTAHILTPMPHNEAWCSQTGRQAGSANVSPCKKYCAVLDNYKMYKLNHSWNTPCFGQFEARWKSRQESDAAYRSTCPHPNQILNELAQCGIRPKSQWNRKVGETGLHRKESPKNVSGFMPPKSTDSIQVNWNEKRDNLRNCKKSKYIHSNCIKSY